MSEISNVDTMLINQESQANEIFNEIRNKTLNETLNKTRSDIQISFCSTDDPTKFNVSLTIPLFYITQYYSNGYRDLCPTGIFRLRELTLQNYYIDNGGNIIGDNQRHLHNIENCQYAQCTKIKDFAIVNKYSHLTESDLRLYFSRNHEYFSKKLNNKILEIENDLKNCMKLCYITSVCYIDLKKLANDIIVDIQEKKDLSIKEINRNMYSNSLIKHNISIENIIDFILEKNVVVEYKDVINPEKLKELKNTETMENSKTKIRTYLIDKIKQKLQENDFISFKTPEIGKHFNKIDLDTTNGIISSTIMIDQIADNDCLYKTIKKIIENFPDKYEKNNHLKILEQIKHHKNNKSVYNEIKILMYVLCNNINTIELKESVIDYMNYLCISKKYLLENQYMVCNDNIMFTSKLNNKLYVWDSTQKNELNWNFNKKNNDTIFEEIYLINTESPNFNWGFVYDTKNKKVYKPFGFCISKSTNKKKYNIFPTCDNQIKRHHSNTTEITELHTLNYICY